MTGNPREKGCDRTMRIGVDRIDTAALPGLGVGQAGALADLAGALLAFGQIERATRHADGITPESDTTHTVMLAVLAGTLAHRWYPELDQARVLWAALAHDLVGDVVSWDLTAAQKTAKARREQQAARELILRYRKTSPLLADAIADYEALASPEDRFVKTLL